MKKYFSAFVLLCMLVVLLSVSRVYATVEEPSTQITSATAHEVGAVKELSVQNVSENAVKLKWKKVKGASLYVVYRFNPKTGKYKKIDTTESNSYTFSNLKDATNYQFAVKGAYTDGYTTVVGKYLPIKVKTAPKKVARLVSSDISKTGITLSWASVSGADGYAVYCFDRNTDKYVRLATLEERVYTATKLAENRLYTFKVCAFVKDGNKFRYGCFSDELLEFTQSGKTVRTNAQAAKKYNTVVNKAKAAGNIKINTEKTVKTKPLYASKYSILMTVNNLANMFNGNLKTAYTFSNGKSGKVLLNDIIQPYKKSAALRGCDIKSFEYKNGEMNIVLKDDSASIDGKTKKIGQAKIYERVGRQINPAKKDISPIVIKSGTQSYNGTKLKIEFDKNDNMKAMTLKSSVIDDLKCEVSSYEFNTKVKYVVKEKWKLP